MFKRTVECVSVQELADAMIVLGYYRMLLGFIQTFDISSDRGDGGGRACLTCEVRRGVRGV